MKTNKFVRLVAIGGGSGLSHILRGLKHGPYSITAIVTVADDGGSTGRLRQEMNIPAPGDVRNVLTALSKEESLLNELMRYRFKTNGALSGHALGNLLLAAMTDIMGDFGQAVKALSRVLAVQGEVLPAANIPVSLRATLVDGREIIGESNIPNGGARIRRVWLDPTHVSPLPAALSAIKQADVILLGPGSLYTSLIPNLLVPGIVPAIAESSARKIYIANLMTQPGETDGYDVLDHIEAIESHSARHLFKTVMVNTSPLPEDVRETYEQGGQAPVTADVAALKQAGYDVLSAPLLAIHDGVVRHDHAALNDLMQEVIGSI
ncbi:MAG: YvcK family protein [Candidatus Carbobacillus altaicus]|nr:YvcK family protein [Candidatus Carbobacillus altaicus]